MTSQPSGPSIADRVQTWRLDTQGLWSESWQLMKREYGVLVGASALLVLVEAIAIGANLGLRLGLFGQIPAVLLLSPLSAGLYMMGVRVARGSRARIEDLFAAFGRYWTVVAISIVVTVASLVATLPIKISDALDPRHESPVLGCGSSLIVLFVCVPLVFFLTIRLWLASVVCLDDRVGKPGVRDSLLLSWVVGGQSFWPMLGVAFTMGLIMIGSILLVGVGIILLGAPLITCAFGVMYTRIVDSMPRPRCPDCGCDLSGSESVVCPVCGGKGSGSGAAGDGGMTPDSPGMT
ncbi:MAG TPA: hypothetical protein VHC70_00010 [Phycisphaerales bacterium]|jgi:hypothetical protein|nr:hypothetical protein [Phycisphaerales bacterium]